MNLTLDAPLATPETGFPAGPVQRPRKSMRAVKFTPTFWVNRALTQGLFPTPRSWAVASAVAETVDADGRWCFKHLSTLSAASGRMLSKRTVQRGVEDLLRARIVRKLDDQQTQAFFRHNLAIGWRSAEHMPRVLELCIPAREFTGAQLEQINELRRGLGEEPLDETTRPWLHPAPEKKRRAPKKKAPDPAPDQGTDTPAPPGTESNEGNTKSEEGGQLDQTPWSSCPPDPSSMDFSSTGADTSVRGTCTTGRRAHAFIARIPDVLLTRPGNDRAVLGRAVEDLAEHGIDEQQLTVLLSGAEDLHKPFPGLMSRLSSPQRARAFLGGQLGRGINRPHGPAWGPLPPAPAWPEHQDEEDFVLDVQGRAAHTCPDHPGVRNTPGGTCLVCTRPCRTEPGRAPCEPHPPAGARTQHNEHQDEESCPQTGPDPGCEADAELTRLMLQSLDQAGQTGTGEPVGAPTPPRNPPARQATIDDLRRRLSRAQDPQRPEPTTTTSAPPVPPPRSPHGSNTPAPTTEPDRTGMPLPGPAPAGAHTGHDPRPHTSPQEPSMNTPTTGTPHIPAPRPEQAGTTRPATPTATKAATVAATALLALPLAPAVPASADDTYTDYAELAAHETEGTDYRRTTREGATDVAHIAIHGGGIERPTTELADHAAQDGEHAFATFEGIKPTGNSILHITSTNFDEPMTVDIVEDSDFTVSWHGAAGQEPLTYVGGLDSDLRESVREELRAAGFEAPDQIPDGLKGESPDNIANRNASGQGVQLEITRAQRDAFTSQDRAPTEAFDDYTAAVERAVDQR